MVDILLALAVCFSPFGSRSVIEGYADARPLHGAQA